jgi:Calcineurin-like phosphoesterase
MADTQPTVSNRNIIVNVRSVRAVLQNHESVSEEKVKETTDDPIEQARLVAGINNALLEIADHEDSPNVLSSPPSAIASQLQSFLAERAIAENKPVARQLPGGAEEAKFDSDDWLGWAKSFFSWAGGLKPAKWQTAPLEPESMPDDAHVALLADWGTGLYGAPACAKCISSSGKPFTHVIHLGDVYYSGTESEIDERFIAVWPKVAGARYLACNGNHEMYSGGHGYFGKVLPLFAQKASYFACENEHWLLVGLDTAYDDHSLTSEQLGWLANLLKAPERKTKKLVLLSHHQPFSLIENQGPKVIGFLRLLLDSGRIHAWYWGHEHRCVIYDRHPVWKLAGRCIGHAGFPYFRDTKELLKRKGKLQHGANGSEWYRMDGTSLTAAETRVPGGLKIPESLILDGANPYLAPDANLYGPHGYVTLEFDGDRLFETFYVPSEPGPKPVEIIARREV